MDGVLVDWDRGFMNAWDKKLQEDTYANEKGYNVYIDRSLSYYIHECVCVTKRQMRTNNSNSTSYGMLVTVDSLLDLSASQLNNGNNGNHSSTVVPGVLTNGNERAHPANELDEEGKAILEHYQQLAMDIYHQQGFFRNLPPMPGGATAIKEMKETYKLNIYLCTSPIVTNPYCCGEKLEWVREHLGENFLNKVIVTLNKQLVRGDILIDDKPYIDITYNGGSYIAPPVFKRGHTDVFPPTWRQIMFDQPYNRLPNYDNKDDNGNDFLSNNIAPSVGMPLSTSRLSMSPSASTSATTIADYNAMTSDTTATTRSRSASQVQLMNSRLNSWKDWKDIILPVLGWYSEYHKDEKLRMTDKQLNLEVDNGEMEGEACREEENGYFWDANNNSVSPGKSTANHFVGGSKPGEKGLRYAYIFSESHLDTMPNDAHYRSR